MEVLSMHIFVFSVLGLLMVGGLIYLYRDIKRMSSWRIDDRPDEGNWNDYLMGDGLTGVEPEQVEHTAAVVTEQLGHFVEGVGHFLHH
jgi:hypothetical protein